MHRKLIYLLTHTLTKKEEAANKERTFLLSLFLSLSLQGFTKEFSSLRALITHHSVMPELLPVPLTLPRPAHVRAQAQAYGNSSSGSSSNGNGDFEMYGSLNDFRKMMADLNV